MGAVSAITLVVGAAILAAGFLSGLLSGLIISRRNRPVRPICACGHSYGAHFDDGDNGCAAEVQREVRDITSVTGYSREWTPCACRRYTGPEPISSDIWVPPMATLPERESR